MNQENRNRNEQANGDNVNKIKQDAQSLIGRMMNMVKNFVPSAMLGNLFNNRKDGESKIDASNPATQQKKDNIDNDLL